MGELIWQENEAENNFFFLIFSEYRKKFQNVDQCFKKKKILYFGSPSDNRKITAFSRCLAHRVSDICRIFSISRFVFMIIIYLPP